VIQMVTRKPTGVSGFDELIQGGLPATSLTLLAGAPGTAKTTFSSQFLYYGATDHKEPGVYVSFSEDRASYLLAMRQFGMDFENLEKKKMFKFLDMLTPRGSIVRETTNIILKEVESLKAKRLVVDSFNALSIGLRDPASARIFLHFVLVKIMRALGTTTILISEIPAGELKTGMAGEAFLADGLVILHYFPKTLDPSSVRAVEIRKMRMTKHTERMVPFEIGPNGIKIQPQAELIL